MSNVDMTTLCYKTAVDYHKSIRCQCHRGSRVAGWVGETVKPVFIMERAEGPDRGSTGSEVFPHPTSLNLIPLTLKLTRY